MQGGGTPTILGLDHSIDEAMNVDASKRIAEPEWRTAAGTEALMVLNALYGFDFSPSVFISRCRLFGCRPSSRAAST